MSINLQHGLAAVAQPDAKVLILGSMPGQLSLQQRQYYAHPRNAFWQIMAKLCGFDIQISYSEKLFALQRHKLALWDVIQSCERTGSLDSNINHASIITNDLATFFEKHPRIEYIFFNGGKAEQEYRKRVYFCLPEVWQALPCTRLPSTSPAMASLTLKQKLMAWEQINQVVNQLL
jgi:hypoxanthine-DNA glycosylase